MDDSTRGTEVAVIGGGVIGCATAWELARRGVRVTVIERDTPGRAASWAAGGMLSPLAESDRPGPFLDFGLASFRQFPAYVARLQEASGLDLEYRTNGKLLVAPDDEAAADLSSRLEWTRRRGLAVEWLDGAEARRREPALSREIRAALFLPDDHRLDSRRLARALWTAAARAGVRFRLGAAAVGVESDDASRDRRQVTGVALADGAVLRAERVLVAAGCWSGGLTGLPRALPVTPARGQMAAVELAPPPLERVVMMPGCYLIPRGDGRLLVGATVEEAGYRCDNTPGGLTGLFQSAMRLVPRVGESAIVELWAGLRPATPDHTPILGAEPELDGLFYATGHFRNGILLAPITGQAMAELITGEPTSFPLEAFSVSRFDGVPA